MLQILGDSFLIATRMDRWHGPNCDPSLRRRAEAPEAAEVRRRGWFRLSGILL